MNLSIDVGGAAPLHVACWGDPSGDLPVVLALHGVTATHMEFPGLAAALEGDAVVVAPDLRGRGRSRDVGGPYGMARHADDVAAVLDHLGVEDVVLMGHSMGGFVSVVTAHRHPERVSRLVLVDGGIPLRVPELPLDDLIQAVIGPAAERLAMTFPSVDAYLDFWRAHPALGAGYWNDRIEAYLRYDLVGEAPELRATCTVDALRGDSEQILVDGTIAAALEHLSHPTLLVRAARGMFDEVPPLYPDDWLAEWQAQLPDLRSVLVPDSNHYTIMLSDDHVATVADLVRKELAAL